MRSIFKGSMVALVTPFKDDQTVDHDCIRELVEWQIASGTAAIVPCGTTGESPTLSHEEHDAVIQTVVQAVNKRVPVLAGCGSNATTESLRLVRHAQDVGADGALVITPYYNKPTQAGLIAHYETIAAGTTLPIFIYNVPGRTGVNIAPETVASLAKISNIVGIKEASGSTDQASAILTSCTIDLVSGDDSMTLPLMAIGGCGVISVVANIVPRKTAALVHAVQKGDLATAEQLHYQLFNLCRMMFIDTNPIPVKAALAMMGKIREIYRLPMVPMNIENRVKLAEALKPFLS